MRGGRRRRAIRGSRCGRRRQRQVALQGAVGLGEVAQLQMQRPQRQKGRGVVGLLGRRDLELLDRVGIALPGRQQPYIGQAQRQLGAGLCQPLQHDRLGLRVALYQLDRQQHRPGCLGVGLGRLPRQGQRPLGVICRQPQPAQRDQCRGAQVCGRQLGLEHILHQGHRLLLVGGALEQIRQRGDQPGALLSGRQVDHLSHRFGHLAELAHRRQDLQLQPQRVGRVGMGGAPGAGGLERLIAGTRLQRDVHRAAKQLRVLAAPCRVHEDLEGGAGSPVAQLHLADQQLIEELGVERRTLRRGRRRVGERDGAAANDTDQCRQRGDAAPDGKLKHRDSATLENHSHIMGHAGTSRG